MKNFYVPDKKQQKLTTSSQSHAMEHNGKVVKLETLAREYIAQNPEFELRTLDNATLTKVCMALEVRTEELANQLKEKAQALRQEAEGKQ